MAYVKANSNETLAEVIVRTNPKFSVDEIKGHAKNEKLLQNRTEFVLREGDPIWLPDEEPTLTWFSVSVGSELKLVAGGVRPFKILLRYPDRRPIKNEAYKLTIDGREYRGTTTDDGMVELHLPLTATHGVVSVNGYRQAIELGALEPIHTGRGVQARLRNLGYAVGPIDGQLGQLSIAAIRRFQKDHDLPVTGKMNADTREKLKEQHGC